MRNCSRTCLLSRAPERAASTELYPPAGRNCGASSIPPSPHSSAIERVLTRAGSAASNPSTARRASLQASGESPYRSESARNLSKAMSWLFEPANCFKPPWIWPNRSSARCCNFPSRHVQRRPDVSRAALPTSCSSSNVSGMEPWMNSAPSSTGAGSSGSCLVHTRPPTRSRASRMRTE